MKSFHEVQFPPKIAYGASGGPEFNTSVVTTVAGFEQRNINWHKARGRWDVSTGIKSKKDMEAVIAFFRARFGKGYGFRFKDWSDYRSVNERLGIGNGKETHFQLVKNYLSGEHGYTREIKKPVVNTVKVYLNNVLQSSGVFIDYSTGVIDFTKAPRKGVEITADFEFDIPVRFDTDQLNVRLERYEQYIWDAIPIIEIRI
jgi:uncharacterized protein (TIGR02217 family)